MSEKFGHFNSDEWVKALTHAGAWHHDQHLDQSSEMKRAGLPQPAGISQRADIKLQFFERISFS